MRELIVLVLFASIGVAWSASCAKPRFGGCDKSRGLCWEAVNKGKPTTTFCTCKAGYVFRNPASRKGKCVDINECRTGVHSCDTVHGRCVNTIGSHYCVCNRGYVLDFTKTQCLVKSKITGICRRRSGRSIGDEESPDEEELNHRSEPSEDELKDDLLRFYLRRGNAGKATCGCETGYARCGNLCKDINECRTRRNKCDRRRGYCHNSIGGYYCSCRNGYLLGPCGFKCYKPGTRPATCTSTSHMASTLVRGDSNGLNDEASKALVLDVETERAARRGRSNKLLPTLEGKNCTGSGSKTQRFDLNRDGKTDVVIHFMCSGGKYQAKSTFDKEAKWTQWTCWTECKATCHGGIQTRARYCKNGLVGEGKCTGPATQYKTCYKGKRCPLRVRRNANKLTKAQKCDLLQAFKKYKADTSTNGFWAAGGTHVFPSQCVDHKTGGQGACCYHGAKLNFVTWHRAELLNFEEGLSRHLKDKTLGLPYWDWLVDTKAPSLVWAKKLGNLANPFASMVVRHDLNPPAVIQRSKNPMPGAVVNSRNTYLNTARKLMESHTIHEFSEELENAHNGLHWAVCFDTGSKCAFSMGGLTYAAFDPIFFFHHTNVDRLFSNFQRHLKQKGEVAWTRQSALEPQENIYHFNEPYLPYRNKTLTSFKRLNELSSMQDLYYYENLLGYTYDTLNVPKAKTGDADKSHIPQSKDAVYVMQYERSIGTNVKITYFVANAISGVPAIKSCSKLAETDTRYVGQAIILGSKVERKWFSKQPVLTPMATWIGKHWGQSATKDYKITACHTHNIACKKNCAQVSSSVRNKIPSPQLMFYPKNIRDDIQKFEWDRHIRMPTWGIDMTAANQWIYFWGREKGNVYQVPSRRSYERCSTAGGHRVTCTGPCVMQTGYHYFVHKNRRLCRKGLKLKVLSSL